MSDAEIRLERLPRFPLAADRPTGEPRLAVAGLVRRPLTLTLDELRGLPAVRLTADFACEEGWRVPGLRWRGVALRTLLELAGVLPEAGCAGVRSGSYLSALPLDQVHEGEPVLAYELDGEPLPVEHGGPLRLVGASTACYESVKWVDRIELLPDAAADTARSIALGRLAQSVAPAG